MLWDIEPVGSDTSSNTFTFCTVSTVSTDSPARLVVHRQGASGPHGGKSMRMSQC